MAIDWSKVTPAPWEASGDSVMDSEGWAFLHLCHHDASSAAGKADEEEDAQAIALLRNAAAVQMERKWSTRVGLLGWYVTDQSGYAVRNESNAAFVADSPAEAILAADEWVRQREQQK